MIIPLETFLAIALITTQPSEDGVDERYLHLASARIGIQTLALEWEILDPKEKLYYLNNLDNFETDLRHLQRRYKEMKNWPPLSDSFKFPQRGVVVECMNFNRKYVSGITHLQSFQLEFFEEYQKIIQETNELYSIWDLILDAKSENYYVTVRRRALERLRIALGDMDYNDGFFPPHVPIWRFKRID